LTQHVNHALPNGVDTPEMGWFWLLVVVVALVLVARIRVNVPDRRASSSQESDFDGYSIGAVGESHYQPALRAAAGKGEVRHGCTAVLVFEDSNPYDDHAVRVDVNGRTVAYLARADARRYRKHHQAAHQECNALIIGGGRGRSLGIWLDVKL
jgi:hypothetical protein